MKNISFISFIFLWGIIFSACEKEDPVIPNQEELITTIEYVLIPEDEGETVELKYRDLDGDGGNEPVISGEILKAGTTYSGTIALLNETETPAENVTQEVQNEALAHQFFFSSTADLTVQYNDSDANGNPVGLQTVLTAGEPGSGILTIVLRHEPDKFAAGVPEGDITNAGGETDVEVQFDVAIQ
ncbi:MAG: hypothetical protein ACOC11_00685 [Prolixibacteraceae bacterium]